MTLKATNTIIKWMTIIFDRKPKTIMRILLTLILSITLLSCAQEVQKESAVSGTRADLNIIVRSDQKIDSLWVADIGQLESFFVQYADTVKVDFKRELNDLINIRTYSNGEFKTTQTWLSGTGVIAHLNLAEALTIKSVQNAPLYETAQAHEARLKALNSTAADTTIIDNYLKKILKKNLDNPLSHAISGNYIARNQNNKEKMLWLQRTLNMQTDAIKRHLISNHERLTKIINVNGIDFEGFTFGDVDDKVAQVDLTADGDYLIDFWFVHCPPCIRDHKLMMKDYNILNAHNINVVGISIDDDYTVWKNYLQKKSYPWTNLREKDISNRLTYAMSISSFPTYLLINREGRIKARFNAYSAFKNYLNLQAHVEPIKKNSK